MAKHVGIPLTTLPNVREKLRQIVQDGGKFEGNASYYFNDVKQILQLNPSIITVPNAFKAGKLYSIVGDDFDVVRATSATRVNESGLIEAVGNNVPRLDYLNGEPVVLIEPQRTNLLLRSQEIDQSPWGNFIQGAGALPIVTANFGTAPDGTMTADRLQCNSISTGSPNRSARAQNFAVVNTEKYVTSCWIKSNTGTNQPFSIQNSALNLDSGFSIHFTATTEWQRVFWVGTSIVTGTSTVRAGLVDPSGATTNDILIWGLSVVNASELTSYIPTVASTVTRNADVIDVDVPAGTGEIVTTFEDDSTDIESSPGATYQLPNGRIKSIQML